MKYLSIDVETTGLDCTKNAILEVGIVLEDMANPLPLEELPTFRALIIHAKDEYLISPYVMAMHDELFKELADARAKLCDASSVYASREPCVVYCQPAAFEAIFWQWLKEHDYITKKLTAAGKNFYGFDYGFLKPLLPETAFRHRALDPIMYYLDPADCKPPSLEKCCERAGIELIGHHTAVADAMTVVKLIRRGRA